MGCFVLTAVAADTGDADVVGQDQNNVRFTLSQALALVPSASANSTPSSRIDLINPGASITDKARVPP